MPTLGYRTYFIRPSSKSSQSTRKKIELGSDEDIQIGDDDYVSITQIACLYVYVLVLYIIVVHQSKVTLRIFTNWQILNAAFY